MCTCLIAGKKASRSGKAILAANDDWEGCPGVLTHVAGAVHKDGEMLVLTGGQKIPQCRETFGYVYTACEYSVGTLDRAWAGGMNDQGVAVAGTGVDAYKPLSWKAEDRNIQRPQRSTQEGDSAQRPKGSKQEGNSEQRPQDWLREGWLLEPDDIPLLVLQRGTTARQAVRMIGDLINAYGLRPSYVDGAPGSSAATFSIADKEEGWVLEVYPGRCWVAVRVPDDCVSVRVNAFGTHDADLTDPYNTISSPGLAAYARERGLWEGDERHFDFAAAFGSETSPTEWGPEKDPMNLRRRWRAMYLVDGIEEPEETLRYLAKPAAADGKETKPAAADGKEAKSGISMPDTVGAEDMMKILSDIYEDTPYDLTRVPEAGPVHDPFADSLPDYALCRQYTLASFVTDYFGKQDEPLMWTAMGIPRLVPYIPVWVDIENLPARISLYGEMKRYCDCIRAEYDRNAEAAQDRKAEYQEKMNSLLREETETVQGNRASRTQQNEGHMQAALETTLHIS